MLYTFGDERPDERYLDRSDKDSSPDLRRIAKAAFWALLVGLGTRWLLSWHPRRRAARAGHDGGA